MRDPISRALQASLIVMLVLAGCNTSGTPSSNNSPTITGIQASVTQGSAPLLVTFTVSASDPDGDTLTYLWDIAGQQYPGGSSYAYTFTTPGEHSVGVTVSDGEYMVLEVVRVTVDATAPGDEPPPSAPPEGPGEPSPNPPPGDQPQPPPSDPVDPEPPTEPAPPEPPTEPAPPEEPAPPAPPEEPAPPPEEPSPPDTPTSPSDVYLFGGMNDEVFLGCLSCPESAANSVHNRYGSFGSQYSSTSIFNNYSEYGSRYSAYSACNPYAQNPPAIVDGAGSFYGRLTVNNYHPQIYRDSDLQEWLENEVCT